MTSDQLAQEPRGAAAAAPIDRKARLSLRPQVMPVREPSERIADFEEVSLPLDLETAKLEALRCIHCPAAPCQRACPLHNDISTALAALECGNALEAAQVFRRTSSVSDICGRICPHDRVCEGSCVLAKNGKAVAIGRLEAYVADLLREAHGYPHADNIRASGKRVAIVGAGPAGLAAAEELAQKGHALTLFDAWPQPGGLLAYGIPRFKLPDRCLEAKLELLLGRLGVTFVGNAWIGGERSVDALLEEGFDAVLLAFGAGDDKRLNVPGTNLPGVMYATEFLIRGHATERLPEQYCDELPRPGQAVVIGGGDTSVDCVRTALRLGAESATIVYRRSRAEMDERKVEWHYAAEEGAGFSFLTAPVKFVAGPDGRVASVECVRTRLECGSEPGSSIAVPLPGADFSIPADLVVLALGYGVHPQSASSCHIVRERDGTVSADAQTGRTSAPGVFAAGDCVLGPDYVVTAVAGAKKAAAAIDAYLTEGALSR
ncbi:MAG: FAD-dependent oxidoreductase [Chloroflexota bacterium]|nr:FAD-dependent oxidoreductase [Chloroflexota bacterium]